MMAHTDASNLYAANESQRLSRVINDLQGILRSQRDILRQRGMSLPEGVLKSLEDVHIGLEQLTTRLKEEQIELGQLRALAETTAMINSSLELDEVLNQAMDTVIHLTGAERGYLMLRNEITDELEYRVARNIEREVIEQSAFTVSRSVVNQVAASGEPVVTTNAQSDPRFSAQESIVSFALRSILCVPLKIKDKITGVIYADNRIRSGLFGETELRMLNAFANQAAVAIENARLFVRVRAALAEITEIRNLMDDVFASIPSGVIVTDSQRHITTLNDAAADILALEQAAAAGQPVEDMLPTLADSLARLLEAVRVEDRRITAELVATIGSAGTRNLNFKLSPLRSDQQTNEGVAVVVDDLTETRQREAQINVVRRYLPPAMVDNIQSIAQLGLGGVRRHITVIYIDVRSMHTLPAGLTPREQMAALNRAIAAISAPLSEYGGVIDKYMGTEVMALFNTQLNPSESHIWDAVQAVHHSIASLIQLYRAENGGSTAHFRIGMHSGIATMGNVGSLSRREFTAIGDTVNLAHRLLDIAQPGEALLSEDVYNACAAELQHPACAIKLSSRGEVEIRGRKQTVRTYQFQAAAGR